MTWKVRARVQFEGDAHAMEDSCGLAGAAAWVVDGATSVLEPLGLPGASDPSWLAQTLSLALAEAESGHGPGAQSPPSGVRGLLAAALRRVDDDGRRLAGEGHVRFPSAAVSVARLDEAGIEVLSLADCHVVLRFAGGGIEHIVSQQQIPDGPDGGTPRVPEDPADPGVREIRARERRNTPGGLWVARREAEAAEHALLVRAPRPDLMVMASDGAWRAVDLGLVSDAGAFLAEVSTPVGALGLMYRLRSCQQDLGEVSDDATVLVLEPADQPQPTRR